MESSTAYRWDHGAGAWNPISAADAACDGWRLEAGTDAFGTLPEDAGIVFMMTDWRGNMDGVLNDGNWFAQSGGTGTLTVDLGATERLAHQVPAHVLLVSESGIADKADARRMALAGARALLVGETLVRAGAEDLPRRVHALRSAGSSPGGAR